MANLHKRTAQDITRKYAPLPGGYTSLKFVPVDDVESIGDLNRVTQTINTITLKAGKSWKQAYLPVHGRGYTERPGNADGGKYCDVAVDASVPYESDAHHLNHNWMTYVRFLLLVTFPSGIVRLVGTLENGARFSYSYDSGNIFKDVPGSKVVWTHRSEDSPPLVVLP